MIMLHCRCSCYNRLVNSKNFFIIFDFRHTKSAVPQNVVAAYLQPQADSNNDMHFGEAKLLLPSINRICLGCSKLPSPATEGILVRSRQAGTSMLGGGLAQSTSTGAMDGAPRHQLGMKHLNLGRWAEQ
jgi:hypothetical protein